MRLLYGQLVEVFAEDGLAMGRVRVGGALTQVTLGLLAGARPGDAVLLCDGVAIAKVGDAQSSRLEAADRLARSNAPDAAPAAPISPGLLP